MLMYFRLQFRMLNRQISDFGLFPVVGMVIAAALFVVFSLYLFYRLEDAAVLYVAIGLFAVSPLSNLERTSFLQLCFSQSDYYRVRLVENALVSAPFVLFLGCKQQWVHGLVLGVLAVVSSLFRYGNTWNVRLTTPFYQHPFEFIIGFRSFLLLILGAYLLTVIAIVVGNFNLGVFALLVLLFCGMAFYSMVENSFYVWVFAASPRDFLWDKINISARHSLILCAPVLIALLIFFTQYWYVLGLVQLFGMLLVITGLLAKYSTFPLEMSLPKAILVGLTIALPPILVLVIPFLYRQSLKNLQVTLL